MIMLDAMKLPIHKLCYSIRNGKAKKSLDLKRCIIERRDMTNTRNISSKSPEVSPSQQIEQVNGIWNVKRTGVTFD